MHFQRITFVILAWVTTSIGYDRLLLAQLDTKPFLERYCVECHNADLKEGKLDLTAASMTGQTPETLDRWASIHERIRRMEMPPKDSLQPSVDDRGTFLRELSSSLVALDQQMINTAGRASSRRMNRFEYENTLRALFHLPDLHVREFLPEDGEAYGFNKVGSALNVSHVQMARYLQASDFALRAAMAPQTIRPDSKPVRYFAWDQRSLFAGDYPKIRLTFPILGEQIFEHRKWRECTEEERTPESRDKQAIAIFCSTFEPTEIRFSSFRAPVAGRYRLRFAGYSIWASPDCTKLFAGRTTEPISIYSDRAPVVYRKLGGFDFQPQSTVQELEVHLGVGETIRPDAARLVRSRPPDHKNPLATDEGLPGVAFQWMEVEGPLYDEWPPASHQVLFDTLPLVDKPTPKPDERLMPRGDRRRNRIVAGETEVVSTAPEQDAARLMKRFIEHVYRGPVPQEELDRFTNFTLKTLAAGETFTESMLSGYTAVLCSPSFLYFNGTPGRLTDRALAVRLSYFLWNGPPDKELRELADAEKLRLPEALAAQTDRMLTSPRSQQFIDSFLDYWLELRHINATSADVSLYPDYDLDDLLVESMLAETQQYFRELISKDLPVDCLIDSKFAMLNERLANHYGIPGVKGVAIRRVELPEDSIRGGLLTQASSLKVTANGTTTSPVKRGVWVMDHIMGHKPPLPPEAVPAVEPDTRGATTIREQLAKHRSVESCNACHKNFDPAGFALECFDVLGGYRTKYRSLGAGEAVKGIGHNGVRYRFREGQPVDFTGELPDGRSFADVRQWKQLLKKDVEQVAKNLIQQLVVYGTGTKMRFSDSQRVEAILDTTKGTNYGVRSLIHAIIQSEMFVQQ